MRLETVRRTRIVTSWRAAGSSADHGRVERLTFASQMAAKARQQDWGVRALRNSCGPASVFWISQGNLVCGVSPQARARYARTPDSCIWLSLHLGHSRVAR